MDQTNSLIEWFSHCDCNVRNTRCPCIGKHISSSKQLSGRNTVLARQKYDHFLVPVRTEEIQCQHAKVLTCVGSVQHCSIHLLLSPPPPLFPLLDFPLWSQHCLVVCVLEPFPCVILTQYQHTPKQVVTRRTQLTARLQLFRVQSLFMVSWICFAFLARLLQPCVCLLF